MGHFYFSVYKIPTIEVLCIPIIFHIPVFYLVSALLLRNGDQLCLKSVNTILCAIIFCLFHIWLVYNHIFAIVNESCSDMYGSFRLLFYVTLFAAGICNNIVYCDL